MERRSRDLYQQRRMFRLVLMFIALGIVIFSLLFTYRLARQIELNEKAKVEEMAAAYKTLVTASAENDIEDALFFIQQNNQIPVIWVGADGTVYDFKNVDSTQLMVDDKNTAAYLEKLRKKGQVVTIFMGNNEPEQFLYYAPSKLLQQVRVYPYVLIALVSLFLLIAYLAFTFSRTAEQNQLWVGMAKETAHQLGTPLSSLSAWIELLEDRLKDEEGEMITNELRKDLGRLELVAERFSKIGSEPSLELQPLMPMLQKTVDYITNRASRGVRIYITDLTEGNDSAFYNPSLMEWVFENLLKNALDAMDGKGDIRILAQTQNDYLLIDVKDSGKGIPTNKFQAVFEPGFTTKKRGWGLGLTLTKRIVEQYHKGKIFVKESAPGQGTTFRIMLRMKP